jgi:hypothetical protein
VGQHFKIWTGGGPGAPEDGRWASAIAPLPDPEPLPRAALITHWWGMARFESAVVACSIRTTPWGVGLMTWLHCKGVPVTGDVPDGSVTTMALLIPAHYVTGVRPGPGFTIAARGAAGTIGLFPPSQPAPPHAIPLSEVERALAGLSQGPADAWGFSISYPLFALRHPGGDYVGFGSRGGRPEVGRDFGIAVFTTEAGAVRFLRYAESRSQGRREALGHLRVERFDRVAVFRRFLRPIRDSGTSVLFDPVPGPDGELYVDHAYPAAVVLERFLPQIAWGWSYPVFVLRTAGPGLTLATTVGHREDGPPLTVLPVFTDADLADRALALVPRAATVAAVPDSEAFARLIRELPAGVGVIFDHEPARSHVGKVVLLREGLLANLENMEL